MEMVLSFFAWLYSISIRYGEDNRLIWNLAKRGLFEVKSYYEVLNRKDDPLFPWKSIWHVKAPARVTFFVRSCSIVGNSLGMDILEKLSGKLFQPS
jgi:hypothetical protein